MTVIVVAPDGGGPINRYIPPRVAISVHSLLLGGCLFCTSVVNHDDFKGAITHAQTYLPVLTV